MRALKPATTTGRSEPAVAATPGHAAPAASRAAAGARSALRSPWWPWPRSPAWAGWPASGSTRKKPAD